MQSETRSDFYVTEEQKKLWSLELESFEKLSEVCNRHGLKYFAACGTLLGAVRHKGFIPWDLDMDIGMPREDYEKLVDIAKDEFQNPFEFQVTDINNEVFIGFGKLRNNNGTAAYKGDIGKKMNQGVWIDIFPVDSIEDDEKKWIKKAKRIDYYRNLCQTYVYRKVFFRHYEDSIIKWNLMRFWANLLCKVKSFQWLNCKFTELILGGGTKRRKESRYAVFCSNAN